MTKTTQISVPYLLQDDLAGILEEAGFEVGSTGSGIAEYVKDGEMPEPEIGALRAKLADALFGPGGFLNIASHDEEESDE